MSDQSQLLPLWEKYKVIEQGGVRTEGAKKIEAEIHLIQKSYKTATYDFDSRWMRKAKAGEITVTGPPMGDRPEPPTPPVATHTVEEAEKDVGENDSSMLRDCVRWVEPRMIIMADEAEKVNVENQRNVARRGQVMNLALPEFLRRKANGT